MSNRIKSKRKYRQQRRQNERAANGDTLALMLQAERRETPAVTVLPYGGDPKFDPFAGSVRVAELVTKGIEYDLMVCGQIDPVFPPHYLDGRVYDPLFDDPDTDIT